MMVTNLAKNLTLKTRFLLFGILNVYKSQRPVKITMKKISQFHFLETL